MRILVTTDEGIHSSGLLALAGQLSRVATVDVFAPEASTLSAGHQRTIDRPLRVRPVELADGLPALTCDGTPSDCVSLALHGALEIRPDLVFAGISEGGNVGHGIVSSGTVGAATEAAVHGVPGVAISLYGLGTPEFDTAGQFAVQLVGQIQRNGLSPETVLNVNVPVAAGAELRGVAWTVLGRSGYLAPVERRLDPRGRPYYWIAAAPPNDFDEPGTDVEMLKERWVSITPLVVDRTQRDALKDLSQWDFKGIVRRTLE
jgi:5'-nucleotidase